MTSLYCAYFRLEETPFSIAPDPRFVYLSERHREALGHLLFGLAEGGGFVQLTGEVGTGKTTICRTLLCQLPDNVDVALIFNPKLTVPELLQSICEELRVESPEDTTTTKAFVDRLHHYLLAANARGRRTVLIIDEAQNLSSDVLEQIRLLTNLETNDNKLLQVFLIGQPELRTLLGRDDLRQLAQRVTARYHLEPLSREETYQYIAHRLSVAGCKHRVFTDAALRKIYRLSGGIPRLVNSLCDRALLGAFATGRERVDARIVARANRELKGEPGRSPGTRARYAAAAAALAGATLVALVAFHSGQFPFAEMLAARSATTDEKHAAAPEEGAVPKASTAPTVEAASSVAPISVDPGSRASTWAAASGTGPEMEISGLAAAGAVSTRPSLRPEPAAPRSLGEIIDTANSDIARGSEQRLLALWGIRGPIGEAELCHRAGDGGLACLAGSGSWSKLRGFDLPALLSLEGGPDGATRAVLTGLVGQQATLYVGDVEKHLPLHEVDRYWTGDFLVLWKPPADGVTVIRPSHSGKNVQWLRQVFARVDGMQGDAVDDSLMDAELATRIKAFQRRRGLNADGIVGPETLIHLRALDNDPQVPSLSVVAHTTRADGERAVRQLSKLTSE